jgi:hypothetical protein
VPLFYHLIRPGENLPAQLDSVLGHIKVTSASCRFRCVSYQLRFFLR